ncbi:MAG TPA: hypothetical protein VK823_17830 [Streptosporangiaceae bacterium]|nr:hypothetical protein [Streptosporangiaceae bacterium]
MATSLAEDPDKAFQYAKKARGLAARVGIVRETCAIAAYQAGDWSAALAEFRAARRLTGRNTYLPLMADCERALGRQDRALEIATGREAQEADRQTQIELKIVESGIRRDQGLPDAAVVALQVPELTEQRIRPQYARLYYAYADALVDAGREEDAREWFGRAASADVDGETDAAERYEDSDDLGFDDLELDDDDPADADADAEDADADADDADSDDADSDEESAEDESAEDESADAPAEADGDHPDEPLS